ncbi:MAG: tryptophan-rich sensory protein [Caulobacteraceae bacterium]|nr:tryptophan-rich sensory protein [Caulobacter sp.]
MSLVTARGRAPPRRRLAPYLVAFAGFAVVAMAGGGATTIGPWYFRLKKPDWTPPGWAFPVVWTTIFVLATVAAGLGWERSRSPAERRRLVGLFVANGLLNIAWSVLFFHFQRPDWALAEVTGLWLSILVLAAALRPATPLGAALVLPYLAWVSTAAVLNAAIVRLNAPFGR